MIRFAFTIFLSAFLLFQVQPLIARYILPWFGGAPAVWTTCMLFFQVLLLGGYAYAHGINSWLKPRKQAILHVALLVISLAFLPIIPRDALKPEGTESPTFQILLLLLITIGLPYFLLSSTGPLIQAWFSRRFPGRSPYRLFSLSNTGSLLALVTFPVLFEPNLGSRQHAIYWSMGHVLFVLACAFCAITSCIMFKPEANSDEVVDTSEAVSEPARAPSLGTLAMWLVLSLVPSVLLLASTNQICQEVAVVPFLWVLPLGLYLISFIVCFDNPRWYSRTFFGALMVLSVGLANFCIVEGTSVPLPLQIFGYSLALFACCMTCHGELAKSRPHPKYLTLFYLFVSLGGALGGVFVVVVAPLVFTDYLELHVALIAAPVITFLAIMLSSDWKAIRNISIIVPIGALLVFGALIIGNPKAFVDSQELRIALVVAIGFCIVRVPKDSLKKWVSVLGKLVPLAFVIVVLIAINAVLFDDAFSNDPNVVMKKRDFFGTVKILDNTKSSRYDGTQDKKYTLLNGRINHGFQFRDEAFRRERTSYYAPGSGVGVAIAQHPNRENGLKLGVIGLGTGTIAAWVEEKDEIIFYEINPIVKEVAYSEFFTYLRDANVPKENVVLGDARIKLAQQLREGDKQQFDVLAVDAFSSDAIPRHLLTQECIELYKEHLKTDGILAIHISNRFLNLEPIVYKLAELAGYKSFCVSFNDDDDAWGEMGDLQSTWILLTNNRELYESEEFLLNTDSWNPETDILWTDDFGSIFQVINFDMDSVYKVFGFK